MKNAVIYLVTAALLLALTGVSSAAQGTKAEAKAMVEKAAAYIKANGR